MPAPQKTPPPSPEKPADDEHSAHLAKAQPQAEKAPEPPREAQGSSSKTSAIKPRRKAATGYSIQDTLNGKKDTREPEQDETDELAPQPDKPRREFSQDQLSQYYEEFVERITQQGRNRLRAVLEGKSPQLQGGEEAVLTLDSKTQESYFEELRTELIQFLRDKLQNYSLVIRTRIQPGSQKTDPYSTDEIYQYLLQKNKHLAELKTKLDLDLE